MDAISLMIEEHQNVKRMLVVIRKVCKEILDDKNVDYDDFTKIMDFVRNYSDKHHHGKEEKFLFNKMVEEIGGVAEKLVKFGMMVEHDLGRLYINELEQSLFKVKSGNDDAKLDIIANAISYTHLLYRHIDKENDVAYVFAEKRLSKETLEKLNKECEEFETKESKLGIQAKYLKLLETLEKKYKIL